jgi:hypothetical protein
MSTSAILTVVTTTLPADLPTTPTRHVIASTILLNPIVTLWTLTRLPHQPKACLNSLANANIFCFTVAIRVIKTVKVTEAS